LTLSKNGGTVTLPAAGGGDNWGNQVVKTNNTLSGQGTDINPLGVNNSVIQPLWSNIQNVPSGFADGIDNVNYADTSSTNELQTLSISGTQLTLSQGGGTVTLPSSGGGDNWGTQVVKTNNTLTGQGTDASLLGVNHALITPSWANIQSVPAGFADGLDNVDDADADKSNEIQALSITGNNLTLSKDGGTVTIPGDNWGTKVAMTDATIQGNGTDAAPLKIAGQGAASGQVLKYNGTTWAPADDATGGGGLTLPWSGSLSSGDPNSFAFSVNTTVRDATAIFGKNTATGSTEGDGIYGESNSIMGAGVRGVSKGNSNGVSGKGSTGVYADGDAYGVYSRGAVGVQGLSTTTDGYGIKGSAPKTGVSGKGTNASGEAYGVYGETNSSNGYGMYGISQNIGVNGKSTGTNGKGLYGEAAGSSGFGIFGKSTFGSGTTYGIYGSVESPNGVGVFGYGGQEAVKGITSVDIGRGVFGWAAASSGNTVGVYGQCQSTSGHGIHGEAPVYGVYGESTGSHGRAVTGEATGTASIGVYGIATSASSTGIWGEGANQGVYGTTALENGKGIYGKASSGTGFSYGVYGESASEFGYGVYGTALIGVYGKGTFGVNGYSNIAQGRAIFGEQDNIDGFSGFFTGGKFFVNADVGIGTTIPTQALDVNGNARIRYIGTGAYSKPVNITTNGTLTTSTSDGRLKENVRTLQNSLNKVMQLRGVSFTWKNNPEYGQRIGFIAQEFEKVIPELVFTNETDGYKGINYAEVSSVLVEAIKELKAANDRLKVENRQQQSRIELMESRLSKLESILEATSSK
jgi:hypothetical protein